jgi:hypothetical protein
MDKKGSESERPADTLFSIEMLRDRLAWLSGLASDVLKLGSVPSIALGLLLVWSFTTRALIPFQLDASSVLLLSVTALACLGLLLFLVSIPLLPIGLRLNRFGLRGHEDRTLQAIYRYLTYHVAMSVPYLVCAFSWPIMLWIGLYLDPSYASNPPVFGSFSFFAITFLLSVVFSALAMFATFSLSARTRLTLLGTVDRRQHLGSIIGVSFTSYALMWSMVIGVTLPAIRMGLL